SACAKLVALETCQRASGPVGEKVVGVEKAVTQELEYAAVQIVCSGFRDQRDHSSAAASVLGGIRVGLNLEFLNAFHRWDRADSRNGGDVVRNRGRDAIEQHFAGRFLPAVHDEAIGSEGVGYTGHLTH